MPVNLSSTSTMDVPEHVFVELRPLKIPTPLKFTRIKCTPDTKIEEIHNKIRYGLNLSDEDPLKIQGQPSMEDCVGDLVQILGVNATLRLDYSIEPIYC